MRALGCSELGEKKLMCTMRRLIVTNIIDCRNGNSECVYRREPITQSKSGMREIQKKKKNKKRKVLRLFIPYVSRERE